jgi:hypothetical protein
MHFKPDAETAADRHYQDGVVLFEKKRFDNAGYHFGLSTECAVKHLLVRCGVPAGDSVIRKEHFPGLREAAIQAIEGRRAAVVKDLLKPPGFMQKWHVSMRYAANQSITLQMAEKWRLEAKSALGALTS